MAVFQTIPEKGRRQRGVVYRAEGDLLRGLRGSVWKVIEVFESNLALLRLPEVVAVCEGSVGKTTTWIL